MRLGVEAALVDGRLVPGDVEVDGGAIAAVGLAGRGRGVASPGFVDLQVNGFAGVDFMHTDRAAVDLDVARDEHAVDQRRLHAEPHPFTAPAVVPRIRCLRSRMNTSATGSV